MGKRGIRSNLSKIWSHVISECSLSANFKLHGISHWKKVEQNGLEIAKTKGANETIVRLFSLLHDCQRVNEDIDEGHGPRAAEYIKILNQKLLELSNSDIEKLCYACKHHNMLI